MPLAKHMGLSYQAVQKWQKAGRMPRTEWTGETQYSEQIEVVTGGQVTKATLLGRWHGGHSVATPSPAPIESAQCAGVSA